MSVFDLFSKDKQTEEKEPVLNMGQTNNDNKEGESQMEEMHFDPFGDLAKMDQAAAAPETEEKPVTEAPETENEAAAPETEVQTEEAPAEQMEEAPVAEAEEPVAEPAPAPVISLEPVVAEIAKLKAQMDAMQDSFNKRILYTEYEEKITKDMHDELAAYKADMMAKLLKPILQDVIAMRDSIYRVVRNYEENPEGQKKPLTQVFKEYADFDLLDILERNEITEYVTPVGAPFDAAIHKVAKKIMTGDESLHGTIAASVNAGYNQKGVKFAPEKVEVYYFDPALAVKEPEEAPAEAPAEEPAAEAPVGMAPIETPVEAPATETAEAPAAE